MWTQLSFWAQTLTDRSIGYIPPQVTKNIVIWHNFDMYICIFFKSGNPAAVLRCWKKEMGSCASAASRKSAFISYCPVPPLADTPYIAGKCPDFCCCCLLSSHKKEKRRDVVPATSSRGRVERITTLLHRLTTSSLIKHSVNIALEPRRARPPQATHTHTHTRALAFSLFFPCSKHLAASAVN